MAAKGQPKSGGRKPGSLNKKTEDLMLICEEKGINVFEAMVELAINEENTDKKFDRLKEVAQYLYSKRKSLEHSGQVEGIEVIVRDYTSKKPDADWDLSSAKAKGL